MTNLFNILKCKKGNSAPLAIVIALAIVIISSGIFEYMRLLVIAQGVRDGVQSSIISVATENYNEVYSSLREGYSGGYNFDESTWVESFKLGDVYGRLDSVLGLGSEGGYHAKYTSDVLEYRVSDLVVNIINAPLAPSDSESANKFLAEATIYLEVPLSFGWQALPPMTINLKCKAGYTPKF